jgi:hypothetical protein
VKQPNAAAAIWVAADGETQRVSTGPEILLAGENPKEQATNSVWHDAQKLVSPRDQR